MLEIPIPVLMGQLTLGLVNGCFYALLSLGLAIIFGMLNIVNFAHGAMYTLGAFASWWMLQDLGLGYWWSLLLAPAVIMLASGAVERLMLRRLYRLDHLFGLLFTFGLALAAEGLLRHRFGVSGMPYAMPSQLEGGIDLGFMYLPKYRAWVVGCSLAVCFMTWFAIERTRLGSRLRAATENPDLTGAFGIDVPALVTGTFAFGAGLAAFAGVLAAPVMQVNPVMGSNLIIVVFAVVVIGGMGSILGSILTGLALGVIEGFTKVMYPEGSATVVFVLMAAVLLLRPAGFFGRNQ